MIRVHVRKRGPFFNKPTRAAAISDCVADAEGDIAQAAFDDVHDNLRGSLRHPTGRYQSRVRVDRQQPNPRVHDGRHVYGPWLEGTGSRNAPVTVFPGYWSFRRAAASVQRRADRIAEPAVDRAVRRLN